MDEEPFAKKVRLSDSDQLTMLTKNENEQANTLPNINQSGAHSDITNQSVLAPNNQSDILPISDQSNGNGQSNVTHTIGQSDVVHGMEQSIESHTADHSIANASNPIDQSEEAPVELILNMSEDSES